MSRDTMCIISFNSQKTPVEKVTTVAHFQMEKLSPKEIKELASQEGCPARSGSAGI